MPRIRITQRWQGRNTNFHNYTIRANQVSVQRDNANNHTTIRLYPNVAINNSTGTSTGNTNTRIYINGEAVALKQY